MEGAHDANFSNSLVTDIDISLLTFIYLYHLLEGHYEGGGDVGGGGRACLPYSFNPLDPTDLPSNMWYFPRISPKSLEISPKFRANSQIQSLTYVYLFIKME